MSKDKRSLPGNSKANQDNVSLSSTSSIASHFSTRSERKGVLI